MAGVDTTTFGYALKTRYPQMEIENEVYKDNPALALIRKEDDFTGANLAIPVRYADTQGRSATFATAQANKGNHAGKQFLLTRVKDYALATITGEVIRASKDNPGAFLRAAEAEMDSALNNLNRSMGVAMYRSGTGSIGTRSSISSTTVTLSQIQDITNFEPGMHLKASATDGGSLRAGTAAIVDSVDRDLGTITSSTWGNITSFADSDLLYPEGDGANGSTNLRMAGFAAWCPTTAPASTAFFGIDRTPDASRLGGIRKDISALPLVEGLVAGANRLAREGGRPNYAFCGFDQFTSAVHELGAKVQYVDLTVGDIGFRGIKIHGGKNTITLMPDQNCPHNLSYMTQLDTWTFHTLGPAPDFLDEDGLKMLREATSDGYEVRMGYYGNLGNKAPGYTAVLTMPT